MKHTTKGLVPLIGLSLLVSSCTGTRMILEFYNPTLRRQPYFVWECAPMAPGVCFPYIREAVSGGN